MKFHRVAKLFQDMTTKQFEGLVADIKEHGQLEPILTCSDKIADGRHRYKACKKLKIAPKFIKWEDIRLHPHSSLVSYVISKNLRRRHLNATQRGIIATRALPLIEAEAKARIKKAGADGGKASGETRREKAESKGPAIVQDPSPKSTESKDSAKKKVTKKSTAKTKSKDRERESTAQAAKQAGVSPRYVAEAKAILKKAPELEPLLESGEITIPLGKQISDLDVKDRSTVIRSGKKIGYRAALKAKTEASGYSPKDLVRRLHRATTQVKALHETLKDIQIIGKALSSLPIEGAGMTKLVKMTADVAALAAKINGKG